MGYVPESIQFVRTEQPPGGGTYRLWPTGGWPRYVRVGVVDMWESFTFTTESFRRPGIRLELQIRVIDGAPQCIGMRLISSPDKSPVTGAVVRMVDLEHWVEVACSRAIRELAGASESVETDADGAVWMLPSDAAIEATDRARKAARRARRAQGGYSPALLRKVGQVYEANVDSFPTRAVRESFGVAQSTAQLYVKKARAQGFITAKAPKGGRP